MKKRLISILQYLVFLSLGIGLLYLVFRKIDLNLLVEELKSMQYIWLVLVIVAGLMSHAFRALRWNLMIRSLGYPTNSLRTFYAVLIGYLANLAIPRLGEVTRCGMLSKSEKIPIQSLIGTVISERVFDMIVLIVITFMVIVFQLKLLGGFVDHYIFSPMASGMEHHQMQVYIVVGVIVASIISAIVFFRMIIQFLERFGFYHKVKKLGLGFVDGIMTIRKMDRKGWFLLYTLLIWSCYFLMTYLCFFALTATSGLGIPEGLTVLSIGSFGIVAPVPGGIGAYHFIVKAVLFELYHIDATSAASYATISHFAQTILIIIGGGFAYLLMLPHLKNRKSETN